MLTEKMSWRFHGVSWILNANLVVVGLAWSNILSASEITAESVEAAAKAALSRIQPIQINLRENSLSLNISANNEGDPIEDNFRMELGFQLPEISGHSQPLYLINGIASFERCIQESRPLIEARLKCEKVLSPQPSLTSFRNPGRRGEFENQKQFEERASQEYTAALNAWNVKGDELSSLLSKWTQIF